MKNLLLLSIFISSIFASNVSTYLSSSLQDESSIKSNLQKVGFEVISSYYAMNNTSYKVIIYTSPLLKKLASKEKRGFVAVQKILISKNDSKLIFTNPSYFLPAMLQDDNDKLILAQISNRLSSAFSLKNEKYNLDSDDLSSYHFMFAMPYYEDMIEVASGDDLDKKIMKNGLSKIVFKLKIKNATLYGIKTNNEKEYIRTLKQESSSAFLPYMVLIENGKAKILAPKYFLALSLPQLTMGEFMSISDVPNQIEEGIKLLFK